MEISGNLHKCVENQGKSREFPIFILLPLQSKKQPQIIRDIEVIVCSVLSENPATCTQVRGCERCQNHIQVHLVEGTV